MRRLEAGRASKFFYLQELYDRKKITREKGGVRQGILPITGEDPKEGGTTACHRSIDGAGIIQLFFIFSRRDGPENTGPFKIIHQPTGPGLHRLADDIAYGIPFSAGVHWEMPGRADMYAGIHQRKPVSRKV